MNAPNRNLLQASVFVDELARSGIAAAVVSPGSRSTPLAFALAEETRIQVYSLLDERGAAFFALGLANAVQFPVVLLCTSGTATANYFPAIVEAHHAGVPLVVLTADRSYELRDSGANQTIDQIKLYGDHVLWSVDVGLPEAQPPAIVFRNLRTLANRAVHTANGIPRGVVHLNFPYRKPLEPTPAEGDARNENLGRTDGIPFTKMNRPLLLPPKAVVDSFVQAIGAAQYPLIVAGPRAGADIRGFAQQLHIPLLADALSGMRYGGNAADVVISGYETFLRAVPDFPKPDLVIQIGNQPISQALDDYLLASHIERWVVVSQDGRWQDPNHIITDFVWSDEERFFQQVQSELSSNASFNAEWLNLWRCAEQLTAAELRSQCEASYFDGGIIHQALDLMPNGTRLFVGSSLPVRHLDQFGLAKPKHISAYCNRGASGIDGTVASAAGVGASNPDLPLVVILGDLALYHDLNSLLILQRSGVKSTIVVINNNGGGIFYRLPVADFDPPFTELFVTPHGLNFKGAAAMFGLHYAYAENARAFRDSFEQSFQLAQSSIIEVPSDSESDLRIRDRILDAVASRLNVLSTKQEN